MILKNTICQTVAVGAALLLVGCGGGMSDNIQGSRTPITDEHPLEGKFSNIQIEIPCKFQVHAGEKPSVKILVDDNLLEHIHTDVVDGTLKVTRCAKWKSASVCNIDVTCPSISALSILGAADGTIDKIDDKTFALTVSGAGDVHAAGACDNLKIIVSGAGNVNMGDVKCKTASVTMSGAGSAVVYATDALNATISGAGSVRYKGNPSELKKQISGVGAVTAI